jgi:molecular chaperone GrpE (heat shock protein)
MPFAKRLTLNAADKQYIEQYYDIMTPRELQKKLGKSQRHIIDYIQNKLKKEPLPNVSKLPPGTPSNEKMDRFRDNPKWDHLQLEFNRNEIKLIEYNYNKYMEQFNWDVLASEETQLIQALELEIFAHRLKKQQKIAEDNKETYEKQLQDELKKAEKLQNNELVIKLRGYIDTLNTTISQCMRGINDFLPQHKNLLKELKGTRDKRVRVSTDSKKTFGDLVNDIIEEGGKEVKHMELTRLANNLEYQRLAEIHVYMDGVADQPIYNADTVFMTEDKDAATETQV